MKFLLTALLVSLSAPVWAQEAATTADFARCSALAEATAIQQRDVIKDADVASGIQKVAQGFRFAAMLATDPVIPNSEVHVNELVAEHLPVFEAKLSAADAVAANLFPADVKRCAEIEPQAYALIKKFNDFQANKAKK